jgi:hypothetical protein
LTFITVALHTKERALVRIESIKIKGFRNFRSTVTLDELADINVLHGENNSGKSNVIDAIELAFTLLGDLAMHQWPDRQFEKWLGLRPSDVFPIERPEGSAEFVMRVALDRTEEAHIADTTGTHGLRSVGSIELELLLARSNGTWRWASTVLPSHGRNTDAVIARTIKRGAPPYASEESMAFLALPRLRSAYGGPHGREVVPAWALEALIDSHDARDTKKHQLWQRFNDIVVAGLRDVIGEGPVVPRFDPRTERVLLEHHTASGPIVCERLGGGVQRIIAMAGALLASSAHIVAIEEPEADLHHGMQLRLRDMFRRIVTDELGPKQLLLVSHSPVFVATMHGYHFRSTAQGPKVERSAVPKVSV